MSDVAAGSTALYEDADILVNALIARVGKHIVLGIPLGLGKPNHIVNALYRRAEQDPTLQLRILTALTLRRRSHGSDLERRLIEPLNQRLFGDYPELAYAEPLARGTLPPNIVVNEFFYAPGSMLQSDLGQQSYVHLDYTAALEFGVAQGMNVFAQLVSVSSTSANADPGATFSMSCNSDIAVDLVPLLKAQQRAGKNVVVCAQINHALPFMPGTAELPRASFDMVLDGPSAEMTLPSVPNQPIDDVDYCIGLHASALVKDGGTLQLGIGALSDAIAQCLIVRDRQPAAYAGALRDHPQRHLIENVGGLGRFARGLYASTEMLVEGFLQLRNAGILRRRVYDNATLQRLVDSGAIDETRFDRSSLDRLIAEGVDEIATLKTLGVLKANAPDSIEHVTDAHIQPRLDGGALLHAGFFLGQSSLYRALRELPDQARRELKMVPVSFVNALGDERALKRVQRVHARFINTGLIATLLGAVASDGLDDGRVLSGPGGQYNFVSMAQELPGARSILLIRSTRRVGREVSSNIRGSYGHTTIPRQLRDIVITEYGIAELKHKSDREIAEAMINIADSRFQPELVAWAQRAGKLPHDYEVPERYRANLPERLQTTLQPLRDHLPRLPFGSDVSQLEMNLARALTTLAKEPSISLKALSAAADPPVSAQPYLERMDLAQPTSLREHAEAWAVVYALQQSGLLASG